MHVQPGSERRAHAPKAVVRDRTGNRAMGRVAPGGSPPGAPTDPDVRNSRIRLFGLRIRCKEGSREAPERKRVALQQPCHAVPSQVSALGAAAEPPPPDADDLVSKASDGFGVPREAEVSKVSA